MGMRTGCFAVELGLKCARHAVQVAKFGVGDGAVVYLRRVNRRTGFDVGIVHVAKRISVSVECLVRQRLRRIRNGQIT